MKKQLYTQKGRINSALRIPYYCLFGLSLVFTNGTPAYSESSFPNSTNIKLKTLSNADITVKGNVTDENGLPLPGASIKVKNGTGGAVTDPNGNFTLNVPEAGTLQKQICCGRYHYLRCKKIPT